jgi:hypothetical protein
MPKKKKSTIKTTKRTKPKKKTSIKNSWKEFLQRNKGWLDYRKVDKSIKKMNVIS